ncbi:MAG: GWxTD domain-containing protein, partial [Bacteroidetes bacterium]|nr:GWxTD domain-containing protein [Bacteroidota bacterium]
HLFLGLLCYENSQNKKAHEEYKKALLLMSRIEEEDFTFNSVKELIKPIFKDKFEDFTDAEMRLLIKEYWKIKEPLYLTKYNERLLEHYSRVTYANLRFSLPKENKPGWQTDRGDIYLRYGEPVNRIRFRPHINAGGRTQVNLKTDVWYYTDMVFGFTDDFMNGNFRFSTPTPGSRYISQFAGDSYRYANYVKSVRNELYDPKFEGPKFKIPFQIAQFKNLNNPNETDVYINYGLNAADSLLKNNLYVYPHVAGFFYSDGYYNLKKSTIDTLNYFDQSKKIILSKGKELLVNSLNLSLSPDSGYFALEIQRSIDKGVSANHDKLVVRNFNNNSLEISDIVLALDIETKNETNYTLKRRKINILPNPSGIFSEKNKLFIYYELYNVNLNGGVGKFEQMLTLKKTDDRSGFSKAVNSVLNIFGMGNENKEIILTTKYQVTEKDPQIYFQLDMNKYEAGDYSLELLIKDKKFGEEVKAKKIFSWK